MSSWNFFSDYLGWFNLGDGNKENKDEHDASNNKKDNKKKETKETDKNNISNKVKNTDSSPKNKENGNNEQNNSEENNENNSGLLAQLGISNWIGNYDTTTYNDYKRGYYLNEEAKTILAKKNVDKKSKIKLDANGSFDDIHNDSTNYGSVCVDTTYYDLLNIKPTASVGEIKNSYYKMALKYHPDKNPNDPEAKLKFQKISEAYQVLSDEERRMKYNLHGMKATQDMVIIDPSVFFMVLFSSEKLKEYIGTLRIAFLVQVAMDGNTTIEDKKTSNESIMSEIEIEQQVREVELALLLRDKIQPFVDGDETWSIHMDNEIKGLLDSSFSSSILESLGWTYENVSSSFIAEVTTLWGMGATVANIQFASRTIGNTFSAARSMINTVSSLKEFSGKKDKLSQLQRNKEQETQKLKGKETERNSTEAQPNHSGKNTKEAEKEDNTNEEENGHPHLSKEENKTLADIIKNILTLVLWDIESTVRQSANKVLRDEEVSIQIRLKRAEALKAMGRAMQKWARTKKDLSEIDDLDVTQLLEDAFIRAAQANAEQS